VSFKGLIRMNLLRHEAREGKYMESVKYFDGKARRKELAEKRCRWEDNIIKHVIDKQDGAIRAGLMLQG
jgi:hypothetical protein